MATQQNAYNTAQLINNQTYQTGELINNQTNAMLQQNNTNLVNAIQGFNNLSQQVSAQTNTLSSKLDQLGYQMDQCLTKIIKAIGNFITKTVGTYTQRCVLAIG